MAEETSEFSPLELATELTVAWLSNPNTRASAEDVPMFLERMHGAVSQLSSGGPAAEQAEPAQEYTPAVTARKSLSSPEHIISMIDGKPYKTLKRHLAGHGLTPAQYRERYGLKSDYPMVAVSYADKRRELAKKIGLGRKMGEKVAKSKPAAPAKTKSAGARNAKTPAAPKPAAAKPAAAKAPRRKKLGVQFEAVGAPDAPQS